MSEPWPNLFVAGAAKAGTTTLWSTLSAHPQIWMSRLKEPHYFSSWQLSGQRRIRSDRQYLDLFRKGANLRYRGEASAGYFPQVASSGLIKAACPDARIVIALREPVARAHSAWLHRQRRHGEGGSFEDAIAAELNGEGRRDVVDPSRYATHIERFYEVFGRERVHVLFFEEMITDPVTTVAAILRFLELDETAASSLPFERRNEFLVPDNRVAALLLGQGVRKLARVLLPMGVRETGERLISKEASKPPIEETARTMLNTVYEPERARLERLLGRKSPW